jgi:hypothetical protein
MPYTAIEDVPGIETSAVDAKELDAMLYSVIDATRFALRHRYNFKKAVSDESALISILRSQLLLYKTTHKSIRTVLAKAYKDDDFTLIPDAASLVREQIEKIYIVAMFLDKPAHWWMRYSRSAWRQDYETYLLEQVEYSRIERHQEFLTKHYPEFLDKTQRIRIGNKTETVVSDFAKRVLTYRWDNPGDERPAWFVASQRNKKKKHKRLRDYIRAYFEFPTPGRAVSTIKKKKVKSLLYRWHKEYSMICEYSHVAFGKILIPTMSEYKDWRTAEKTDINGRKLAEKTIYLSLLSAATSCAFVVQSIKTNYGAKNELKDFWQVLYETSLPGKLFWEGYIKSMLK